MTYERYQQLGQRLRLFLAGEAITCVFDCVNEWSIHIQRMSTEFYNPGTNIAVDECMIRYTGRSKETVTIPTKPTPIGFKIWAAAHKGYFLQWIWHRPAAVLGPAATIEGPLKGPRTRKRKRDHDDAPYVNPMQAVIVRLINKLPEQTYHVYLDNLFTSPDLFRALRDRGAGATGTCRKNSGIFADFVKAKEADTKGQCWQWNTLISVPTPDGLVRDL